MAAAAKHCGGCGNAHLFVNITRVDEEARMVYGYATTEAVDSYGTIIDLESVRKALPDYLKWRNIREMHQPSAVGVAEEISLDEKGLYIGAHIVDDMAWKKVKAGVYKGFSIGAKLDYKIDNRLYIKRINEITLGDRPSNEDCTFDAVRTHQGDEEGIGMRVTAAEATAIIERIIAENPANGDIVRYAGEEVYDSKTAIYALGELLYIFEKEKTETGPEAAAQTAALAVVIRKLREFIASEIMEDNGTVPADGCIELTLEDNTVERIGAKISKANAERIQAMHDAAADLGAACRVADKGCKCLTTRIAAGASGKVAIIGAATDDATVVRLGKLLDAAGIEHNVATEGEDVARIIGTAGADDGELFRVDGLDMEIQGLEGAKVVLGAVVKRLGELEQAPAPAKGVARVVTVSKEQDGGEIEGEKVERVEDAKTPDEAIKRIHQGGGTRIERF